MKKVVDYYATKIGYSILLGPTIEEGKWWWVKKVRYLLKNKLFMCLVFNNKVLTREIKERRKYVLRIYILYRNSEKNTQNTFLPFPFTQ